MGSRRNKPKAIPMAWKKKYAKIFREKGYTNEARMEVLELYKTDFKNHFGHEPEDEAHTNCMIRLCNKNRDAILMDGAAFRNFGHKLKTTKDKSPNSWSFEVGFRIAQLFIRDESYRMNHTIIYGVHITASHLVWG